MKKRTFLKISSALVTGSILSPLASCEENEKRHNWAGNLEFGANRFFEPATPEDVKEIVAKLNHVRPFGTAHAFNTVADSEDNMISLKKLNNLIEADQEEQTVTVGAGMRYGELSEQLQKRSFALHNLASLPHISVAGACATATHGSGVSNGNLSTAVRAIEFITADGQQIGLSRDRDGEKFLGSVVALGALGVVTRLALDVRPTYQIRQNVYQHLPLEELKNNFDAIMSAGYSVSLFTDWQNKSVSQVWVKSLVDEKSAAPMPDVFFGAKAATKNLHPIEALDAENCTDQLGVAGPWFERLPHFKLKFTPSSGQELQAEYFVPRSQAIEAILAVERMRDEITPHLFISEIRTIDADNLWLSPCYHRPSVAIHFTLRPDGAAVSKLLPRIEKELAPFDARPHWAKLFTLPPDRLHRLYEKMDDFRKLVKELDPKSKFGNSFIRRNIFGESV